MNLVIEKMVKNDYMEDRKVFGSQLVEVEASSDLIRQLQADSLYYSEFREQFKEETGVNFDSVASLKVGEQWYEAIWFMGSLYIEGFEPTEGRVYEPMDDEAWEEYEDEKDENEVGPFGGAFEDEADYWNWKEGK